MCRCVNECNGFTRAPSGTNRIGEFWTLLFLLPKIERSNRPAAPNFSPPETSLDASRRHFVFSGRRGPDLVRSWRICAMGDTPAEGGTKKFGFLKTIGGAFGGLLSGAIMMYASPLIDKFVKPANPIATSNFHAQATTLPIHN